MADKQLKSIVFPGLESRYVIPTDADTLDGKHASDFISTDDFDTIKNKIYYTNIPSGSDLNDFRTPGFYRSTSSSNLITNAPANAFELMVTGIADGTYCTQLLKLFNSNSYYIRTQTAWTEPWSWTSWVRLTSNVLTSDDYGTSLPAAGTAGRIFFKKVSS